MSSAPQWWRAPRRVSVVTDNDGWMLRHCRELVRRLERDGERAALYRSYDELGRGGVAFLLNCHRIASPEVLARNHRNLVVHASDLPAGRGWSPLTWQVLEGRSEIPVCLLEAVAEVDAGPVVYRERLALRGDELLPEMQDALGRLAVSLCRRFLAEPAPPPGTPQSGEPTWYPRRRPRDSRLDPGQSLAAQFELLRVVDNERYPAYFEWRGRSYRLRIDPLPAAPDGEGD